MSSMYKLFPILRFLLFAWLIVVVTIPWVIYQVGGLGVLRHYLGRSRRRDPSRAVLERRRTSSRLEVGCTLPCCHPTYFRLVRCYAGRPNTYTCIGNHHVIWQMVYHYEKHCLKRYSIWKHVFMPTIKMRTMCVGTHISNCEHGLMIRAAYYTYEMSEIFFRGHARLP